MDRREQSLAILILVVNNMSLNHMFSPVLTKIFSPMVVVGVVVHTIEVEDVMVVREITPIDHNVNCMVVLVTLFTNASTVLIMSILTSSSNICPHTASYNAPVQQRYLGSESRGVPTSVLAQPIQGPVGCSLPVKGSSCGHVMASTVPMSFATTSNSLAGATNDAWYPDSGATHHITYDRSTLQTGVPYTGFPESECTARREAYS